MYETADIGFIVLFELQQIIMDDFRMLDSWYQIIIALLFGYFYIKSADKSLLYYYTNLFGNYYIKVPIIQ